MGVVPENSFGISSAGMGMNNDNWGFNGESPRPGLDPMAFPADLNMDMNLDDNFTWEMIGLGLEEPLPPQDTIDELYVSTSCKSYKMKAHYTTVTKYTSIKSILHYQ